MIKENYLYNLLKNKKACYSIKNAKLFIQIINTEVFIIANKNK